ncbi:MAG TPA: DNA polymerase III subunit gamma/tau [Roseiflexaceae bacterium]|nr:DNA polymerase III subunit gamma/tau [Roseiflexaceae bacterium]HMP42136.1 DNA polymerase III subunit gamma/tau [Roseiflexaceae bacterium]
MASQALYRRYRSQTFNELVGQEHIVQTLRNALAEGRIAHAYLFTGPRGVGKTTVARLLAKAVNCTAALPDRPCGACDMCRVVADGRAVDVIEMDAASHTSVEDAREIIERVQFRPTSGQYKVHIIDEVHMLSTAAFNALLKTLEEPPEHAIFVLATTEVHKVPETILSRCQRFTFNRHSVALIADHLRAVAASEGFTLDDGAPEAIARAATGSMRDALSVLDQLMSYGGDTIVLAQVRGLLGASEAQEVVGLVDALLAHDLAAALHAVAAVADQGSDLRQFTRDLVERLRALLLLRAGADAALLDATDDELAVLQQQVERADLGAVLRWTRLFSELDHQLRTSPYGQLPLEMAIVEAIAAPPSGAALTAPAPARPAAQRPASRSPAASRTPAAADPAPPAARTVEPLGVDPPLPVAEVPNTAAAAGPPETPITTRPASHESHSTIHEEVPADVKEANASAAALEHIEGVWNDVVRDVRVFDKTLQALLNSGVKPADVNDNVLILEVANEWLLGRLEKPNLRQIIERVLSKHMGAEYRITAVVETQHREHSNVLREQIRHSRKDPLVKAAINIFDADIIGVEPQE